MEDGYDPRGRLLQQGGVVLLFVFVVVLLAWAWCAWPNPPYSPDSWAYFELSQSIWNGGYRLHGLRGYAYPAQAPSGAFPPLWPFLWSLTEAILHLGARTGLALNFGCVAVLAYMSEMVGRRLTAVRWVGLACAAVLLGTPGFAEEVVAARSIPLQLALVATLAWVLLRHGPIDRARAALLGVICGALVLARFDATAFVLVFGLTIFLLSRSAATTGLFGLLVLGTISPWVAVSWLHFGELLHSDSSFVASAVDPTTFVTDWLPAQVHRLTIHDDPTGWAAKVLGNAPIFLSTLASSPGLIGLMALGAVLIILVGSGQSDALARTFRTVNPPAGRFMAMAPAIVAPLPLYVVTGYIDARYFSLLFWYLLLAGAVVATVAWSRRRDRMWVETKVLAATGVILLLTGLTNSSASLLARPQGTISDLRDLERIDGCLHQLGAGPHDRILFENETLSARWAGVRGRPSAMLPRNFRRPGLTMDDKRTFLSLYGVRFVVGTPDVLEPIFKPLLGSSLSCGPTVYSVPMTM